MGNEESWGWQPSVSPTINMERTKVHWNGIDSSSVNAVSFGFVATAILVSMFVIMAIFERFLRPISPQIPTSSHHDIESHLGFNPKLALSSPKMTVYSQGLSVLMPGEETPTFIAQPAPLLQCPPDQIQWPPPNHKQLLNAAQSANTNAVPSSSRSRSGS